MVQINDTPHSAKRRMAEASAALALRASKNRPKPPKVDYRRKVIERLQGGDLLLMNGSLRWTWDSGRGKPPVGAVKRMIAAGELVGDADYLLPPREGKLPRSQVWRLADGVN